MTDDDAIEPDSKLLNIHNSNICNTDGHFLQRYKHLLILINDASTFIHKLGEVNNSIGLNCLNIFGYL